jgi:hypothetical protein
MASPNFLIQPSKASGEAKASTGIKEQVVNATDRLL